MRVLVTFAGGTGHFLPLLPVARELADRGHQVAVSCQPAMLATAAAAGFEVFDSGGNTLLAPTERRPLLPVDREHERQVVRRSFAGSVATARADRLIEIALQWQADLILRDELDFGAAVAAERLGWPHVAVLVLAAGALVDAELVAEPLNGLRARHGLAPDPTAAMLHRQLTLVPVPPRFRSPEDLLPATARFIRPALLETERPTSPARRRPRIYFTLGTIFGQESGDLFGRVLAGLAALDADVLVTVGRELDPAELGPQPANVTVERFRPAEQALADCDVLVSPAGSGSVLGALAFGVPMVLLPMGADQPLNADRCAALGVAAVLDPVTVRAAEVTAAVECVLAEPRYRRAAAELRDEAAGLPTARDAVDWIEALPGTPGG